MLLVGLRPQVGIPTSRARKKEKLELEMPKKMASQLDTLGSTVALSNLVPLEALAALSPSV